MKRVLFEKKGKIEKKRMKIFFGRGRQHTGRIKSQLCPVRSEIGALSAGEYALQRSHGARCGPEVLQSGNDLEEDGYCYQGYFSPQAFMRTVAKMEEVLRGAVGIELLWIGE